MTIAASSRPVPPQVAEYVAQEVARATAIYRRLYPVETLDFVFFESQDPVWSAPTVTEGAFTFRPDHFTADYLGHLRLPGQSDTAPCITITLTIPRPPLPAELKQTDQPWTPPRALAALFALSPLSYEQIRWLTEMKRKRRSRRMHQMRSLPRGTGSSLFPLPQATPAPDKRPAILIGLHWLEVGGAEKLGFDCVEWALEAGLRVIVVAAVPSLQRLADRLPDHPDVEFIRLDRYLPHHLWPRYIEKLARAENIRIVHIHHCVPLYETLPQLRALLPDIRVIDSTHIVEYLDGGYPRISGVWSNFIDSHHVISGELVDYFRDQFRIPGKAVLGRMLTRPETPAPLPPVRLQAGQKTLSVIFIGRLYYQKRPVVVIGALRALAAWAQKNGVTLTATIVGEGPFLPVIRRLIQRYGLAGQVTLQPANANVPALLEKSDILLLPSNNEGLALVCYEAVAHGCIPVSTDVGSQNEVVPAELLLPLSPRGSVRGIVRAVDRLWRDPAFLEQQKTELHRLQARLAADPTAKEVLMPQYLAAAAHPVALAPEPRAARAPRRKAPAAPSVSQK